MSSLLKISILLAGMAAAQNTECGCYSTDGVTAATYTNRIYHDFRSLDETGTLYTGEPANITNDDESSAAPVQTGYLTSDAFVNDFGIQTWGSPASEDTPLRKQYSNANVYIEHDGSSSSTHLTLRSYRNADFVSTAEIDSKLHNIFHASITVRARVRGAPGACAGIFTYLDDKTESDIEILTRDPSTHIRYTNQPGLDDDGNEIPGASTDAVLPNGAVWTDWVEHRLDWTPELSAFYANGELVETKTYGIPDAPSSFIVNIWGDGGSWSGTPDVGSAAYLDIQWIEVLFNTSDASV
ncbi:concanavalin A-like lectin/glucanase domain-containing protein [Aspergillus spinulosporus]